MQFRSRRRATTFDVILRTEFGEWKAEIVDATEKGARIRLRGGALMSEGSVVLDLLGRPHPASIVWAKDAEIGLEFDTPLSTNTLAIICRQIRRPAGGSGHRFLMS